MSQVSKGKGLASRGAKGGFDVKQGFDHLVSETGKSLQPHLGVTKGFDLFVDGNAKDYGLAKEMASGMVKESANKGFALDFLLKSDDFAHLDKALKPVCVTALENILKAAPNTELMDAAKEQAFRLLGVDDGAGGVTFDEKGIEAKKFLNFTIGPALKAFMQKNKNFAMNVLMLQKWLSCASAESFNMHGVTTSLINSCDFDDRKYAAQLNDHLVSVEKAAEAEQAATAKAARAAARAVAVAAAEEEEKAAEVARAAAAARKLALMEEALLEASA